MREDFDFVIVGGGPAGLSAAITAARAGHSALLLEMGSQLGPRPRGEGVNHFPLFDDLLGEGALQAMSRESRAGAVFHSPGAKHRIHLPADRPLYFFEWRDFIDRLGEVAEDAGATLRLGCRVTDVLEGRDGRCLGVRYLDADGESHEVGGTTVLGCDGYRSVLGRRYGINYAELSCRIIKCRICGAGPGDDDSGALQFYLIGHGDLDYAPRFPPAVAYVFPLSAGKAEVGLMLRMGSGGAIPGVQRPSEAEFLEVWSHLKTNLPGFSRYLEGARIEHEEATDLPNARLVLNNVPAPGAVLVGDAVGFIDPFGSSGIYASMKMARLWTDEIGRSMRRSAAGRDPWTKRNLLRWRRRYYASRSFRHVALNYVQIGVAETIAFRYLGSGERINRHWGTVARLLALG